MKSSSLTTTAILALLPLVACGTPGAPQPPSLELPRRAGNLTVTRKADNVSLVWTTPAEATDHRRIKHLGSTRICRGVNVVAMVQCPEAVATLTPSQTPLGEPVSFTNVLSRQFQEAHMLDFASYAVQVENTHGRSAGLSNQVVIPLAPTLPAPTDLKAQVTPDGVELTWTGSLHEHDPENKLRHSYRVYRREQGTQKEMVAGEVQLGSSMAATLLDRGVQWEKTYDYKVTAVTVEPVRGKDEQVEGDDSPEVEVFVHDVFPPAVPSGLQAVSSGTPQQPAIDLNWAPDTESDLAGYNIYRHGEGTPPLKVNRELVKTPVYRDTDVQAGHTYFYSVTAVDVRGNESAKSGEAEETSTQYSVISTRYSVLGTQYSVVASCD